MVATSQSAEPDPDLFTTTRDLLPVPTSTVVQQRRPTLTYTPLMSTQKTATTKLIKTSFNFFIKRNLFESAE